MAFEGETGAAAGATGDAAALLTGGAAGAAAGEAAAAAGDGGAGGGEGGAGSGEQGGADPDWYNQVTADLGDGEQASLRDWLKSANVRDINGLAKMARDSIAAARDSGRIKVPGENATDAEKSAFRAAIGVPDKAEGYALAPIVDGDGNEVALDTPVLQRLAAKAHEAGVPKAAYEALVNDFVQMQLESVSASDAENKLEASAWVKEQGQESTAKLAAVNRGAEALGLSGEDVVAIRGALGARKTLDTLAKLGSGIGEDMLLAGDGGANRFGMTGAQAQVELDSLIKDAAFGAKAIIPGTAENARVNRLNAIIGADANRKAAAGM